MYIYIYGTGLQPSPSPPRDGDGSWNPTIMQGISASPPPLRGGLGVVCMYLHRLVGIGMYVCVYVCIYVCIYVCMCVCMHACMHVCMYSCFSPPVGWGGGSMYVPT